MGVEGPSSELADPAFDGMELGPALHAVWGADHSPLNIVKLKGEASTRSYYRVTNPGGHPASLVVMRLGSDTPVAANGPELPFLNVHRHLAALGVPVPKIYVDQSPRGLVLLQDLGDETFEQRLLQQPHSWLSLYTHAVDLLAMLHERAATPQPACIAYQRAFDRPLLSWELDHFREWGLEALGVQLSPEQRRAFEHARDRLVAELLSLPQGFVHRDYQSRNLMWSPDGQLVVIDFQDALQGPVVYDLVALLCDSYVALDQTLQQQLIRHYAELRDLSCEELERAFWLVAVQRKLKDAGRFVFIDQARENPAFLPAYVPSLQYVGRALGHLPDYSELLGLLEAVMPGFPVALETPPARTGAHAGRPLR